MSLYFLPWSHFIHHAIQHQDQELLCVLLLSKHNWWMNIYGWIYNLITNMHYFCILSAEGWEKTIRDDHKWRFMVCALLAKTIQRNNSTSWMWCSCTIYGITWMYFWCSSCAISNQVHSHNHGKGCRKPLKCLNKHFLVQETMDNTPGIIEVSSVFKLMLLHCRSCAIAR